MTQGANALPALAVYGGGPRASALALALARQNGWRVIGAFATRAEAATALRSMQTTVLVLDARVAADAAAEVCSRLGSAAAVTCFALLANGDTHAESAGLCASNGEQLVATLYETPAHSIAAGTWLHGIARPPLTQLTADAESVGLYAHVAGASGFATAGRNLALALRRNGVDVGVHDYWGDSQTATSASDAAALAALRRAPRRDERTIVYRPVTRAGGAPFLDRYRDEFVAGSLIAATMFETDTAPARWVPALERCEAVWVPSPFVKESFVRSGVSESRIDVVPIGLDLDRYTPDGPGLDLPGRRGFAFLSVFDWSERKGPDVLLHAWARAFAADDDVVLYVRTGSSDADANARIAQTFAALGIARERCAPVIALGRTIGDDTWTALFRSADAFVLPTRGEGFCIPYLEAMALGVPVIGVAAGGSSAFVDATTAATIPVTSSPVSEAFARSFSLYAGQRWLEPDPEATIAALRAAAQRPDDAMERAARAFRRAHTEYGLDATGAIAARALDRVPQRPARDAAARFTLHADVTGTGVDGAVARAVLRLADGAHAGVALASPPAAIALDAGDERRITDARDREPSPCVLTLNGTRADAAIYLATRPPLTAGERQAFADARAVWAATPSVADALRAAGIADERMRITPLPIDVERNGPDTRSRYADPAVLRFLIVVETDRPAWRDALRAYCAAFGPQTATSLTLLFLEPPSPERDAIIRAAIAANGDAPNLIPVEFPPSAWEQPRVLGIHDIVIGDADAPWPIDALIAAAAVGRIPADAERLRDAARNESVRTAAAMEALHVAQEFGIRARAGAFAKALDAVAPLVAPQPFVPDVLTVVTGTRGNADALARIADACTLRGRVIAADTIDAADGTERYIARVPAGTWLPFGWDLQLVAGLDHGFDADAITTLDVTRPEVGAHFRAALATGNRAQTAHIFALEHAANPLPPLPVPADAVVLARRSAWRTGLTRCRVAATVLSART